MNVDTDSRGRRFDTRLRRSLAGTRRTLLTTLRAMHEAGIADEDILALLEKMGPPTEGASGKPESLTHQLAVILLGKWGLFVRDGRDA